MGSDYLQRLHDWNERCCWYYRKGDRMTIDSPYLKSIVDCAFGNACAQPRGLEMGKQTINF